MKNESNHQLVHCKRAVDAASIKRLQVQFPNSVIHLAFSIDDQRQKRKTLKEANLKIASLQWKS